MSVDGNWLAQVRTKNQQQLGLAGMGGMGQSLADQISASFNQHRARSAPPPAPSAAAQAAATPPPLAAGGPPQVVPLPPPSKAPTVLLAVAGLVAVVGAGALIYRAVSRR